jgi:hypothetical protein
METHKSLLVDLAETIDRHLPHRSTNFEGTPTHHRAWLRRLGRQLVPNLGSVLLILVLLYAFPGVAAPSQAPSAASTATIPYQGRLADTGGSPVTGMQNMEFRIYNVPTGGTPLWEELWTGGNAVSVSDGLFSVMLGSLNTGLASVVQTHDELYLGITVGTDSEMSPRVQLGSVPISIQALTVPDDSITSNKIVDGAVGNSEIAIDAVSSAEILDGSITQQDAPALVGSVVNDTKIVHGQVSITGDGTANRQSSWIDVSSAGFSDPPECFCTLNAAAGFLWNCHVEYVTEDKFKIWVRRNDGTGWTDTLVVNWIAIGE